MADTSPSIGKQTDEGFMNVALENDSQPKKKQPRKILHFSDGILEEYSTDEEDDTPPPPPPVDPKVLPWLPWMWYYLVMTASKTLGVADLCGEKLAWFFGITSPKYQYAIDEYYKMKEEEEIEKAEFEENSQAESEQSLSAVAVELQPVKLPSMPSKHSDSEETEKY